MEKLSSKNKVTLVEMIGAFGIVGAGGSGYPTHLKLEAIKEDVDTVIVNAVECEPLLASDAYLLHAEIRAIIQTLDLLLDVYGARRGIIAVKRGEKGFYSKTNIELIATGDFYPAGDERILVHALTGRLVPEGGNPGSVGCAVFNIETVFNIFNAVFHKLPVTRKYLTCTGEVRYPSIVHAHIGVSIQELLDLCGGAKRKDGVVIVGGPVTGRIETDFAAPVTKTSNGVIVLPENHQVVERMKTPFDFFIRRIKSLCADCLKCSQLCPRNLIGYDLKPHLIMRQIKYGLPSPFENIEKALLCSLCGLCEIYACTRGLAPGTIVGAIKESLIAQGHSPLFVSNKKQAADDLVHYRRIPTSRITEKLQVSKYTALHLRPGVSTAPSRVELLLKQSTGFPSEPVVKIGESVEEGQVIGRVFDNGHGPGACVHSSIKGEVIYVDDERIIVDRRSRTVVRQNEEIR
jgi:Na+-translocating ferredoxin:NAD+ oxidoreductase RnfC subunit